MPIDTSMYSWLQAPDIGGAYEKGLKLKDLAQKRKDDEALKEAYKRHTDETGNVNRQAFLSDLGKAGLGQQALELKSQFATQDAAQLQHLREKLDTTAQFTGAINDQPSYDSARAALEKNGILDPGEWPSQWDPNLVKRYQGMALTYKERLDNDFRERELKERSLDRQDARAERRFLAKQSYQTKMDDRDNQYVEKLQGKIAPLQDIQNSLSSVESQMGFALDDYDPKTNKAKGNEVDLPGVSVPGVGRFNFYSDKARTLDNSMARVFNVELKDRSGAAVTTPELERLKAEFSSGKFNTEQEKIAALKEYKRLATIAMKNVEAGYEPRVVDKYQDRGGMTSRTVGGGTTTPSGGMVVVIAPNGKEKLIPQSQVEAALASGGRLKSAGNVGAR
ncbi:MAG: hypothetical protein AB7G93_09505 [Bdellovibrionales bacterium]